MSKRNDHQHFSSGESGENAIAQMFTVLIMLVIIKIFFVGPVWVAIIATILAVIGIGIGIKSMLR